MLYNGLCHSLVYELCHDHKFKFFPSMNAKINKNLKYQYKNILFLNFHIIFTIL
jgi:hypothetical protein